LPVKPRRRARRKHGFFNGKVVAFIVVVLIVVSVVAVYQVVGRGGSGGNSSPTRVVLVTSMGNITIELYGDMPITSGNFKNLVNISAYDGTIFHRVVHDFVVQGGNVSGKGISVPTIVDELPNKHSNVLGSVAMAKTSEPNSATSQFYINLKDNSASLDSNYVVFGHVVAGMDVVNDIGAVPVDANDKPKQDVTLIQALIIG
jgi:peptidylprolyl isomerase